LWAAFVFLYVATVAFSVRFDLDARLPLLSALPVADLSALLWAMGSAHTGTLVHLPLPVAGMLLGFLVNRLHGSLDAASRHRWERVANISTVLVAVLFATPILL